MSFCLGLVVPSLEVGGGVPAVARFILSVVRKSGVDCTLIPISLATSSQDECSTRIKSPNTWFRGPSVRTGVWEGLPLKHVGANWTELEFQRYFPRAVLADAIAECDVLQVVAGTPAWANAVIGFGKPVALQVATRAIVERRLKNSMPCQSVADYLRKGFTSVTNILDDRALRGVNAIQVENPWMFEYAKNINKNRCVDLRYAPPGIDCELFCPAESRDLSIDPYIFCVARFGDPRKNIILLIEAYSTLSNAVRESVRIVLAGSTSPPQGFWDRVNQLGLGSRIEYIRAPSMEEIIRLYQRASVFALPSDEEGLGVVLLESMACGVPVVSTRCGGPDGIISDGIDGFLVPLDDPSIMGKKLDILLGDHDLNRKMGFLARNKMVSNYAEKVTGEVFVDMWEKLAKN